MRQLCGIQLVPIIPQQTATTSPSDPDDTSSVDPVEEALVLFRANSLFRAFDVRGPGDKLLVYLLLFISSCLRRASLGSQRPSMFAPCLWGRGQRGRSRWAHVPSVPTRKAQPPLPLAAYPQGIAIRAEKTLAVRHKCTSSATSQIGQTQSCFPLPPPPPPPPRTLPSHPHPTPARSPNLAPVAPHPRSSGLAERKPPPSKEEARQLLFSHAHDRFPLPGQAGFPLGGLMGAASGRDDEGKWTIVRSAAVRQCGSNRTTCVVRQMLLLPCGVRVCRVAGN